MNNFRFYFFVLLFVLLLIVTFVIYRFEEKQVQLKREMTELNNIRYGLFSVDEWKNMTASIIARKIHELELSDENKEVMREKISAFLYELIDGFEDRFYEEKSKSLSGIIQSGIVSLSGTFSQLRQDVPVFTEQIIAFLDDPESRDALQAYLSGQLDEYSMQTFSATDYSRHNSIIEKYGFENRADALGGLALGISQNRSKSRLYKISLVVLVILAGLVLLLVRNLSRPEMLIFIAICLTLLVPGVLLPMIEIDARIAELSFTLLGEQLGFQNQVLFYQSKSILEIVAIMFAQKSIDLIFVGVLILAFSVLFPLAKLLASVLYIYSQPMKKHRLIQVLVFRTGKWSMADVMVVAIFMAYIGFNGIITDQLQQIESLSGSMEVITTNNSGILSGFWFFTAFVLLGLALFKSGNPDHTIR